MGWTAIVTMLLAALGLVAPGAEPGGAPEPPPSTEAPPPGPGQPGPGEIQAAPVRYEVAGDLPALDGEAQAWTLGAGGDDVVARAAAVAEALGLAGEPRATDGGWEVVGDDGARLTVDRSPGLPWHHTPAGALGSDTPVEAPDEQIDCEMPPCPPGMMCAQVCPPRGGVGLEPAPDGDVRDPEAAEAVAARVLSAAGVDLEQAEVTVDDVDGRWIVTAAPQVGELPTVFLESSVTVGRDGAIGYANGWLAEPADGDEYALIGTDAALERLRAGQGGPPEAPEPDPDCGDDCFEPEVVTITGVRIGLQALWLDDDGPTWLVPSYLFTVERAGGPGVHAVVGVDDARFTPPAGPTVPEGCELIGGDAISCPDGPPAPEPPSDGGEEVCRTAERGSLTLEACARPARPRVGEEVRIEVEARDREEAVADDCASPLFSPDRGVDVPRCMIAFEPPPGAGPDEVARTFTHTYDRPGRHVPSVEVNASCTAEAPCRSLTVEVPLTVRR